MKNTGKQAKADKEFKRSDRTRNPPEQLHKSYSHSTALSENPIEPQTFKEAIESVEKESWTQAMESEMESLNDSQTWTLVVKLKNANVIPGTLRYMSRQKCKLSPKCKKYFV